MGTIATRLGVLGLLIGWIPFLGCTADAPVTSTEPAIPGLVAVDVYGNFEDRGFTLKRSHGKTLTFWTCTDRNSVSSYQVDITGDGPRHIIYVSGTFLNFGAGDTDVLAKQFLGFLATIYYEGADSSKARKWVDEHISDIGSKITIGDVVFNYFRKRPFAYSSIAT